MTTLRAHFDGKVLVPDEPVDLPTGRSLRIRIIDEEPEQSSASPTALLEVLRLPPRVSQEDVDALEQSIREGKLPVRFADPFEKRDDVIR